jgi:hypothetical protein
MLTRTGATFDPPPGTLFITNASQFLKLVVLDWNHHGGLYPTQFACTSAISTTRLDPTGVVRVVLVLDGDGWIDNILRLSWTAATHGKWCIGESCIHSFHRLRKVSGCYQQSVIMFLIIAQIILIRQVTTCTDPVAMITNNQRSAVASYDSERQRVREGEGSIDNSRRSGC